MFNYVCVVCMWERLYSSFLLLLCRLEISVCILCFDLIKMLLEHFFKLIMDIPLGLLCQ